MGEFAFVLGLEGDVVSVGALDGRTGVLFKALFQCHFCFILCLTQSQC